MSEAKYDAFISYRRSDGAMVARWLRRELEAFRPPKSLREKFAAKLRIYQDTAYERGTSDFYDMSIRPALLGSRFLLVVATPDAVLRPKGEDWIQREVEDFTAGPNARNVVAVRAAGEFNDRLPADLATRFPNIEIVDLRGASRFWFLNPAKASRLTNEKLKLIAPLIGLPGEDMPKLRQEEEKRQQARLGAAAGVTLAVLIAVSSASIFAILSRNRATRALESSMFAAGRMVVSLSGATSAAGKELPKPNAFVREACDLIDQLSSEAARPPNIGETVACRMQRGVEREGLKESDAARREFETAIRLASERHAETGQRDAGYWLVQAHFQFITLLASRKDTAAVERAYIQLAADAKRLAAAHENWDVFLKAEGEALAQLGDLQLARKDFDAAGTSYDAAADAIARAVAQAGDRPDAQLNDWLARLYHLAGHRRLELADPAAAADRFGKSIDVRLKSKPDAEAEPGQVQALALAISYASRFEARQKLGQTDAASKDREAAIAAIDRVAASAAASADLKLRAEKLRAYLAARAAANAPAD